MLFFLHSHHNATEVLSPGKGQEQYEHKLCRGTKLFMIVNIEVLAECEEQQKEQISHSVRDCQMELVQIN